MNNKIKNIVVTVAFVLFIAIFVGQCCVAFFNPVERSESERRPLAQFPEDITWAGIIDKTVINGFEDYTVDQFPLREFFRSLKAKFQIYILGLKENNGYALEDGYIAKIENEFNTEYIDYSVSRIAYIYNSMLKGKAGNVYISIVPEKNYFFGKDYGYPMPDYEAMVEKLQNGVPDAKYIDIFQCLELEDYYRTDTHWSQDKLGEVVDKLSSEMGFADRLSGSYIENKLEGFKGVYYSQSALYPTPDTLTYLTNDVINSCTVYDYETNTTIGVYNHELFEGADGYDFFLSGSKSLLRIDNPKATTDKELVIFRDSFGSSIAPLLAEGYKTVYVVDTRYILPFLVGNMIDFTDKDVLFLYSSLVLNQKAFK